jgi:hypothetical protein
VIIAHFSVQARARFETKDGTPTRLGIDFYEEDEDLVIWFVKNQRATALGRYINHKHGLKIAGSAVSVLGRLRKIRKERRIGG